MPQNLNSGLNHRSYQYARKNSSDDGYLSPMNASGNNFNPSLDQSHQRQRTFSFDYSSCEPVHYKEERDESYRGFVPPASNVRTVMKSYARNPMYDSPKLPSIGTSDIREDKAITPNSNYDKVITPNSNYDKAITPNTNYSSSMSYRNSADQGRNLQQYEMTPGSSSHMSSMSSISERLALFSHLHIDLDNSAKCDPSYQDFIPPKSGIRTKTKSRSVTAWSSKKTKDSSKKSNQGSKTNKETVFKTPTNNKKRRVKQSNDSKSKKSKDSANNSCNSSKNNYLKTPEYCSSLTINDIQKNKNQVEKDLFIPDLDNKDKNKSLKARRKILMNERSKERKMKTASAQNFQNLSPKTPIPSQNVTPKKCVSNDIHNWSQDQDDLPVYIPYNPSTFDAFSKDNSEWNENNNDAQSKYSTSPQMKAPTQVRVQYTNYSWQEHEQQYTDENQRQKYQNQEYMRATPEINEKSSHDSCSWKRTTDVFSGVDFSQSDTTFITHKKHAIREKKKNNSQNYNDGYHHRFSPSDLNDFQF